jgi:hypothetical protein
MIHTATGMAAGIPPPCNPLLHCSYAPSGHFSMLALLLRFVAIGAVALGLSLLLRRINRGPGTGWWRRIRSTPDGPRPASPDGRLTEPREASEHSHRRRPRPAATRRAHPVGGRSEPVSHGVLPPWIRTIPSATLFRSGPARNPSTRSHGSSARSRRHSTDTARIPPSNTIAPWRRRR